MSARSARARSALRDNGLPTAVLGAALCWAASCAAPDKPADSGLPTARVPSLCALQAPLEYSAQMPHWDDTLEALLAVLPQGPVSGTLESPEDATAVPVALDLAWQPGPRDAVLWYDSREADGRCASVFTTDFAAGALAIDGVPADELRVHTARLDNTGLLELTVYGAAPRTAGTVLEPTVGRGQASLRVHLLAIIGPDSGEPRSWTTEVWVEPERRGEAADELLARGAIPWDRAPDTR